MIKTLFNVLAWWTVMVLSASVVVVRLYERGEHPGLLAVGCVVISFSLFYHIRGISKKSEIHTGLFGKQYDKPVPSIMWDQQYQYFSDLWEEKVAEGMEPREAADYAAERSCAIYASKYGLKEKPFRGKQ